MECVLCNDSGLFHHTAGDGSTIVYVCKCPRGEPHKAPRFFPSDRKKERPFFFPVLGAHAPSAPCKETRLPYKD